MGLFLTIILAIWLAPFIIQIIDWGFLLLFAIIYWFFEHFWKI